MKRIALSFLALVMMLSLVACGGESGKKVELSAVYEELCGIAPELYDHSLDQGDQIDPDSFIIVNINCLIPHNDLPCRASPHRQ